MVVDPRLDRPGTHAVKDSQKKKEGDKKVSYNVVLLGAGCVVRPRNSKQKIT